MAMSVTYTNVLGQVLYEDRGGVGTEFIPDPLGNVVKCKTNSVNFTYSAEYWPYGEIQTSTGTNPSNFGYVGTWGYYKDGPNQTYVSARYYRPVQGRWMTVDPLWPRERAYGYVGGEPNVAIDPSGEIPHEWPIMFPPDDLLFSYGNYCGNRACTGDAPFDCVDRACKAHDECLKGATFVDNFTLAGWKCNCAMCAAVTSCLGGGCLWNNIRGFGGILPCYSAARLTQAFACSLCLAGPSIGAELISTVQRQYTWRTLVV